MLVSPILMGKTIHTVTSNEIKKEKEHFMEVCYIVRIDKVRYKQLLEVLRVQQIEEGMNI